MMGSVRCGERSPMEIDVDALRDYLLDYCGTAAFCGMGAAMFDVWDIERMGPSQLVRKAEQLGIDLRRFEVRRW